MRNQGCGLSGLCRCALMAEMAVMKGSMELRDRVRILSFQEAKKKAAQQQPFHTN